MKAYRPACRPACRPAVGRRSGGHRGVRSGPPLGPRQDKDPLKVEEYPFRGRPFHRQGAPDEEAAVVHVVRMECESQQPLCPRSVPPAQLHRVSGDAERGQPAPNDERSFWSAIQPLLVSPSSPAAAAVTRWVE